MLSSESKSLQDIGVIGYGTTQRKDLTGSVSSISAETIAKLPVPSVEQALQGRAAGVQVTTNDGSPGGNVNVLIRGTGSLGTNGNGPLYVVDGYPIIGGLNNLNPNEIATIDVLKDASATAIYGVRAANGVVIITTKKGKKGTTQLSVDAYTSFQSKPKFYDVLNAEQWATLALELNKQDANFSILPEWNSPSKLTNIDWQDALYQNGLTQSYNIGIRGGSDKTQSAVSIAYYDQKGIVLKSYFKRLSLGANLDYQPTTWLKSSTSVKYSYQNSNNPYGTGSLGNLTQLIPTLDGGNKLTSEIKDSKGNYGFFNPDNTYTSKYNNPVYTLESNEYENLNHYLLTTSSLEVTLLEGLRVKTNGGINFSAFSGSFFQPEDARIKSQYPGAVPTNALYSQNQRQSFEWLWENTIAYDKTFGKHAISFVGGVSAQHIDNLSNGGSVIPPNSTIRDLAQGTNLLLPAGANGKTTTSLASEFARLTYKFADRYLITGTVRRDGSSKFDEGHQYGIFPSAAVAWRAKEESFLKDVSWLAELKFRGSYGEVGNERGIGGFGYQGLYNTGLPPANSGNLGYPFGKIFQPGYAPIQPDNPFLSWETNYMTDIGMDISFLKGDLNVTVDWFRRKSKNFLLPFVPSVQTGYPILIQNVGAMTNKGFEVTINYNKTVNDFHYGIGLTFSAIKNKLTEVKSGTDFIGNLGTLTLTGEGWTTFTRTYVGKPVGEFYGYQSLGIFQSQSQIDALNASAALKNPSNPFYQKAATKPGDRYFADTNGDGQVTPSDQIALGSPQPKFFGGLNLDASYKAFDINIYFYGMSGNKILNYQKSSLQSFQNRGFVGVENISVEYYNNRWTPNNPSNEFSRATYTDNGIGSNAPSSAWIEDGSFLKLKNLTFGYTLPAAFSQKFAVSKARLYFSTQNLLTITGYSGLDPEIGIQGGSPTQNGIDNGTYPGSKFYTLGVNVTF
ncbi:MAG: TonB-dependent receptor [Mucilaginibacter sp.]